MKVLMVCANTYRTMAPAPIGASLVASRLRDDGHEVRLLDLMFARSPAVEAARLAREHRPDLVCYSIRNVDSQSATAFFDPLPVVRSIVAAARAAWPAPMLLGGTGFTTFPAQFLQALDADYGIAGDDLGPVSRFVASLAAGRPDLGVPGLAYRAEGGVRCNPFEISGYADTVFDGWDFLDLRRYRRSLSAFWDAGLVVRTGCPFQCVYCDAHRTFGRRWVLRDPRQVAQEALVLQRRGARHVFLVDAGFNRPLDHAKEVLAALIGAGVRLSFTSVFEPGEIDQEFARLYRRAGGVGAMVFAVSLSEPVLARARKPFQVGDVLHGASLLREAGVDPFLYLTFGGPGETPATVEETLRLTARIRPVYTLVDHGFRLAPGTELREIAIAEGLLDPADDCFRARFYHSPGTPRDMLAARLKRHEAERRWDALRGLPWMARLAWDKLRP